MLKIFKMLKMLKFLGKLASEFFKVLLILQYFIHMQLYDDYSEIVNSLTNTARHHYILKG